MGSEEGGCGKAIADVVDDGLRGLYCFDRAQIRVFGRPNEC